MDKWWTYLVIGLIIGAILGYAASEQNWFKKEEVGARFTICDFDSLDNCKANCKSNDYRCQSDCERKHCRTAWK